MLNCMHNFLLEKINEDLYKPCDIEGHCGEHKIVHFLVQN
jgi:hypothetical protein